MISWKQWGEKIVPKKIGHASFSEMLDKWLLFGTIGGIYTLLDIPDAL